MGPALGAWPGSHAPKAATQLAPWGPHCRGRVPAGRQTVHQILVRRSPSPAAVVRRRRVRGAAYHARNGCLDDLASLAVLAGLQRARAVRQCPQQG